MVNIISTAFCIAAIITAFFSATWAWALIAPPALFLIFTLRALKKKRWKHIPELSEPANLMIQKFGHYYLHPRAGGDFSASCSALMITGILIAIIGAIKGFWWGIALAVTNYVVMGPMARAFNPANFLSDPVERLAHNEVISFVLAKQYSEFEN